MVKVKKNIVMEGMSGALGDQLILKWVRGGRTILCVKPTFDPDRQYSEAQLAHQQRFREASAYGRQHKRDPLYLALAKDTAQTGYNVALGDWLNPPQILEIDLRNWHGASDEPIRMCVQDDVQVVRVRVEITDEAGGMLEAGQATEAGALWWEYRAGQPFSGTLVVMVYASDLPGHVTQASETRQLPG